MTDPMTQLRRTQGSIVFQSVSEAVALEMGEETPTIKKALVMFEGLDDEGDKPFGMIGLSEDGPLDLPEIMTLFTFGFSHTFQGEWGLELSLTRLGDEWHFSTDDEQE